MTSEDTGSVCTGATNEPVHCRITVVNGAHPDWKLTISGCCTFSLADGTTDVDKQWDKHIPAGGSLEFNDPWGVNCVTSATVEMRAEVGAQTHDFKKIVPAKPGSCLAEVGFVFTWKGELRLEALDLCEVS